MTMHQVGLFMSGLFAGILLVAWLLVIQPRGFMRSDSILLIPLVCALVLFVVGMSE